MTLGGVNLVDREGKREREKMGEGGWRAKRERERERERERGGGGEFVTESYRGGRTRDGIEGERDRQIDR